VVVPGPINISEPITNPNAATYTKFPRRFVLVKSEAIDCNMDWMLFIDCFWANTLINVCHRTGSMNTVRVKDSIISYDSYEIHRVGQRAIQDGLVRTNVRRVAVVHFTYSVHTSSGLKLLPELFGNLRITTGSCKGRGQRVGDKGSYLGHCVHTYAIKRIR
jgi:hypothetical protein